MKIISQKLQHVGMLKIIRAVQKIFQSTGQIGTGQLEMYRIGFVEIRFEFYVDQMKH